MSLSFAEVCSGCGGLGLGLKKAGLKPVYAVDSYKPAVGIYKENVDKHAVVGNMKDVHFERHFADVVVGGLPCQGFSTLGKRNSKDSRNYLWMHFVRLLKESKAEFFLIENVPQFLESFHFRQFLVATKKMEYKINYGVLNAYDYGVAQNRRRAVIMGGKKRPPELPKPSNDGPRNCREAIGDLPLIPDGKNDHVMRNVTALSMKRYKHIPPGGNRFDLPEELKSPCWRKLKTGASNMFGRLEWDKPSGTIRTTFIQPECGRYLHPEANRPLTIREGARLQGFEDAFNFNNPYFRVKAKVIGNSVPVPFAEHIGESLLSAS